MGIQIVVKTAIVYIVRKVGDNMTKDELFDRFTKELFKLRPIDFIGVAYMFGVDLAEVKTKDGLNIEEISYRVLKRFTELSKDKQKEMVKLCRLTNKNNKGSDKNGNRSETE